MSSGDPAVSVIVAARNAAGTLPALLDALAQQRIDREFETIIAVDHTSTDDTVRIAEQHPACTRVVYQHGAMGAGAARNMAAAEAHAPVLAFTDADCAPARDWLAAGLAATKTWQIAQGVVLPTPAAQMQAFDRTLVVTTEYGLYETANLFVRRGLFQSLGGFQDLLHRDGRPFGEDTYFVWRAKRDGAPVGFATDAVVYHAVFPEGIWGYISERARRRYFPALVRLIPELREAFLYRRVFLSPRTAAFDAFLLSAALTVRTRSPLGLLVALPYARMLRRDLLRWSMRRQLAVKPAMVFIAADAVSCVALVAGSVTTRSAVL